MEEILEIKDVAAKTPPAQTREEAHEQGTSTCNVYTDQVIRTGSADTQQIDDGSKSELKMDRQAYTIPKSQHSTLRKKKQDGL